MSDLELERIMALGWRGTINDRLGDWLLRAAEGWTGRANSVLPLGDPGVDTGTAVAHTERWYAGHGLPARFAIPLPAREDLHGMLIDRGWVPAWGAMVMTAAIDDVLDEIGPTPSGITAVRISPSPDNRWLAGYHYRGGPLPPVAPAVLRTGTAPRFLSTGGPTATGICRTVVEEEWLGIAAVEVDPAHRRQGIATLLLVAALRHGLAGGAHHVYLQVESENVPARRLYERVGFTIHHRYSYVQRRPGADPPVRRRLDAAGMRRTGRA